MLSLLTCGINEYSRINKQKECGGLTVADVDSQLLYGKKGHFCIKQHTTSDKIIFHQKKLIVTLFLHK